MPREALAFWVVAPEVGELRRVAVPDPAPGDVRVRTLFSGVSRGTERLVYTHRVPPDQYAAMRAPFQAGEFPAPVEYGYLNVGEVVDVGAGAGDGPSGLLGRTVFCLFPHQSEYVVPAAAVTPVPSDVPPSRAVLAGTVETAVNVLWDASPQVGDRVAVIGAGMVGCCVARLAGRIPGVEVTLVDVDAGRAAVASALEVGFASPDAITGEFDVVVHASATEAGLRRALELVAPDCAVIEVSWYGSDEVSLPLGGAFHSRRLTIRSSQVGAVSPTRRGRRTNRERVALALELLRDPAFDVLLEGPTPLRDLPAAMSGIVGKPGLCHLISYD